VRLERTARHRDKRPGGRAEAHARGSVDHGSRAKPVGWWSWRESNPRPPGADSPCYDRSREMDLTLSSCRVTNCSSRLSVRSVGLSLRVSGLSRLSTLILFPRQRVVLGVPLRVAMSPSLAVLRPR